MSSTITSSSLSAVIEASPPVYARLPRSEIGAGLIGAGVGLAYYNAVQPYTGAVVGQPFWQFSNLRMKGVYRALAAHGAQLMYSDTAEKAWNARIRGEVQRRLEGAGPLHLSVTDMRKVEDKYEGFTTDYSWSLESLPRQILGPNPIIAPLLTVAGVRAIHAGVFRPSTFKASPFWTGKLLVPASLLLYALSPANTWNREAKWRLNLARASSEDLDEFFTKTCKRPMG